MKKLRALFPKTVRDLVLPRTLDPSPPPDMVPPWQPPFSGRGRALESHRFEHAGRHHRLHLRLHGDGGGLVVVDAARLARLDAAGVASLRAWLAADAKDAAAQEQVLWGEPVLTGRGPVRGWNAWDGTPSGIAPLPEIPVVATLEVAPGGEQDAVSHVRRLAELLVPHVVLRPLTEGAASAVREGVRAAEDAGLVTGVAAPADFVDDGRVLDDLAELGLDHLALTLAGAGAASHDAVLGTGEHAKLVRLAHRAAALEVPLTAELPLLETNWMHVGDMLAAASDLGVLGVTAWALVAEPGSEGCGALASSALRQVAATLERAADTVSHPVTWAAPARSRDVRADIARGPRAEGDFGMRVCADGAVLAPRGPHEPCGHLATASWDAIRASAPWRAFLGRARGLPRCAECPGLALCAVDCPAAEEGWAR